MAKNLTYERHHFANDFEEITPSSNDLDPKYTYISTATAGDITVVSKSGNSVTYTGVSAAFIPPVTTPLKVTAATAVVLGHWHNED